MYKLNSWRVILNSYSPHYSGRESSGVGQRAKPPHLAPLPSYQSLPCPTCLTLALPQCLLPNPPSCLCTYHPLPHVPTSHAPHLSPAHPHLPAFCSCSPSPGPVRQKQQWQLRVQLAWAAVSSLHPQAVSPLFHKPPWPRAELPTTLDRYSNPK